MDVSHKPGCMQTHGTHGKYWETQGNQCCAYEHHYCSLALRGRSHLKCSWALALCLAGIIPGNGPGRWLVCWGLTGDFSMSGLAVFAKEAAWEGIPPGLKNPRLLANLGLSAESFLEQRDHTFAEIKS